MSAKGLSSQRTLIAIGMASVLGFAFTACGKNWEYGATLPDAFPCLDPSYSDYHSPRCVMARCRNDAGIPEDNCADGGASSSGSSLQCVGTCVPNEPDGFEDPQPVYIGPPLPEYAAGCPLEIGELGARRFTGFQVFDPGCTPCVCGAVEGACSIRPNSLVAQTDVCDQPASTTDFGGPPNWDGSCTSANAIPMGAECPPASGVLCAQSIDSTAMLEPVESCAPIQIPVPNFATGHVSWDTLVLSCSSSTFKGECTYLAAETCLPPVPPDVPGWRYCVRREGINDCPKQEESDYWHQFIAYPEGAYSDTRACTECKCTPKGSSCAGTLRVYSDDSCNTNEIIATPISSDMTNCTNLPQSGAELRSKEVTDIAYAPGMCEPSGGESIGVIELHEDEAVTWCCMGPHVSDAGIDAAE